MPEQARERWSTRTAFVMAAIGSAVGLGNVWRFPYIAYANGGGAFFIPYLVALITAGIPLMILEFGIGQMMQGSAPTALRKCNKHAEWIGWFALLTGTIISIYYAVVMAWAVEYLVYSFKGMFTGGVMPWSDPTILGAAEVAKGTTPEEHFFLKRILNVSLKSGEMWTPVWPIVGCLVAVWVAVFAIICRGVKRVGRVVMWTVPLPLIVLAILFVRGVTLPGAAEGIRYYLTPDFTVLGKGSTWLAAYGQVFFSLTIGFGVLIAYASYRPRGTDITNNAFITSFANCAVSFFAGFAVFSVLGYLAFAQGGVPVKDVVSKGGGLAFITYPKAISLMGEFGAFWPPIIAVLFFVMLLTLGIDSLFSLVEGAVAGLRDRFPRLNRVALTGIFCAISLLVGVFIFASRAGMQWVDIFGPWTDYGLVIVGLLQCVVIGYFFKTDDLRDRINEVSEIKLWGWWELCIRFITPIILVYLLADQLGGVLLGQLPGAAGDDIDKYLWIAPVVFGLCFIIAFALSRRLQNVRVIVFGVVLFGAAWLGLRRGEPFDVEIVQQAGESFRNVVLEAKVDGGREPYTYLWTLGDDATSTEQRVNHTYDAKDTVPAVGLSVADSRGRSVERSMRLDTLPMEVEATVRAGGSSGRPNPRMAVFKAEVKHGAPDYTFVWDFGDGSDTAAEANTRHLYPPAADDPVSFNATLTVTDKLHRSVTRRLAVVVCRETAHAVARPLHGHAPLRVGFKPRASGLDRHADPNQTEPKTVPVTDLDGWKFAWDLGDGTTTDEGQPDHVYAEPGAYAVSLTATSPNGSTFHDGVTITVEPPVKSTLGGPILCAVAGSILLGGLAWCLLIARRHGTTEPDEAVHGLDDEGIDDEEASS